MKKAGVVEDAKAATQPSPATLRSGGALLVVLG